MNKSRVCYYMSAVQPRNPTNTATAKVAPSSTPPEKTEKRVRRSDKYTLAIAERFPHTSISSANPAGIYFKSQASASAKPGRQTRQTIEEEKNEAEAWEKIKKKMENGEYPSGKIEVAKK